MADTEVNTYSDGGFPAAGDKLFGWRGSSYYGWNINRFLYEESTGDFIAVRANFPRIALGKTATGTWYLGGDGGAGNTFNIRLNALTPVFQADSAAAWFNTNLGIGLSTPAVALHVVTAGNEIARLHGQSANPFVSFFGGAGAGARKGYFQMVGSSYCAVVSELPELQLTGGAATITVNSTGLSLPAGQHIAWPSHAANGPTILGHASTGIHFYPQGAASGERIRIAPNGGVALNRTSPVIAGIGYHLGMEFTGGGTTYGIGMKAQSNSTSMIQFHNAADGVAGSITLGTTTVAYNTSSDRRLKKYIADAGDAGEVIDAIKVRSFQWRGYTDGEDAVSHGVIAQELVEHFPQAVHVGDDETLANGGAPAGAQTWQVDHSKLVPLLIKEMQALRARVAELEGA